MQEYYEIVVKGSLDPGWSDWFMGLDITPLAEEGTTLSGMLPDQVALHGLLERIRDLNLILVSISCGGASGQDPPAGG